MVDKLTFENFSNYSNTKFIIHFNEDMSEEAELVEVNAYKSGGNPAGRKSFSLVFKTESSQNHEQGTYKVEHGEMPEMLIFLVPIGPDGNGFCYEAVFN